MDDIPPPPPTSPLPSVPVPRAAPAKRPAALTGAGGILLLAGVLSVVVGSIGLAGDGLNFDAPFLDGESAHRTAAVLLLAQGVLALIAGWLVLRLSPAGRILGLVVATLGIVAGLLQLRSTGSSGFLALALDAYVLYALIAYGFVFKGGPTAR